MIIDLTLNRKDGAKYEPKKFYNEASCYGTIADLITGAMDGGSEEDVKNELNQYIKENNYNLSICQYINSVNWL